MRVVFLGLLALGLACSLAACSATEQADSSNQPPTISLAVTPPTGPAPLTVTAVATAQDPDGDPLTYLWDVAGQPYEDDSSFSFTFNEPGEHRIGVVASDGEYMSPKVAIVTVTPEPAPPVTPEPPEEPSPPTDPAPPEDPEPPAPPEEPTPPEDPAPPEEPAPPPPEEPTPPEEPAPPPPETPVDSPVESVIVSDFDGFNQGNIYELANGQVWQQTEFYFWFYYAFRPQVSIYSAQGQTKMHVYGIEHDVTVTRIQ